MSNTYNIIRNAIIQKQQVVATYDGHLREQACNFLYGHHGNISQHTAAVTKQRRKTAASDGQALVSM